MNKAPGWFKGVSPARTFWDAITQRSVWSRHLSSNMGFVELLHRLPEF